MHKIQTHNLINNDKFYLFYNFEKYKIPEKFYEFWQCYPLEE